MRKLLAFIVLFPFAALAHEGHNEKKPEPATATAKYFSAEAVEILTKFGAVSIVRNGLDVSITLDKAKEIVSENGNDKVFLKKVISLQLPSAAPTEVRIPKVKGISGQHDGWINWVLQALLMERLNEQRDKVTVTADIGTMSVVIDNETGKVVKQQRARAKR